MLRTKALAIVALSSMLAAPGLALAAGILPPNNPTSNLAPQPDFFAACVAAGQSSPSCTQQTVQAIDAARAAEKVGPLKLPQNWSKLTAAEQIFVLTNLERVDRGLAPIEGLVSALDAAALKGAKANTDPAVPATLSANQTVEAYASNWAGGLSPLSADYEWMYADGLSASSSQGNLDCNANTQTGCWGHRDNILTAFDQLFPAGTAAPAHLVMGAAETTTAQGSSIAEILALVSGPAPAMAYTWQQAKKQGADSSGGWDPALTAAPGFTRLGGADRMGTAVVIANREYPGGPSSHTAIIASGANANLIDSVTVAPLATAAGAPILLSQSPTQLGAETLDYLRQHAITNVYLVGAAANDTLAAKLPSGVGVTRLSGPTRFQTAAAVATALQQVEGVGGFGNEVVVNGSSAFIGLDLAVAPNAAANGVPILLYDSTHGQLPAAEQPFVADSAQNSVFWAVTGSDGSALHATVPLAQWVSDPNLTAASATTFDNATAVAVAQAVQPTGGYARIDVANRLSLVDAITGAPLAAMQKAPLLFTDGNTVPSSLLSFIAGGSVQKNAKVTIFGGPASIGDAAANTIAQAVGALP